MTKEQAAMLTKAIFGSRAGEMSMVENNPDACTAFRIAFPLVAVGDDRYGGSYSAKKTMELKEALVEWAEALPDDDIPF